MQITTGAKLRRYAGLGLLLMCTTALHATELPDFTGIVKHNQAAVVNISTTQIRKAAHHGPVPDVPPDSPLNDFFKRFFDNAPEGPSAQKTESLGSGFIIADDGYLLTNAHVVKDADTIIVRLSDRREIPAEVIGLDERSDVALLKISADHLPTVTFGDSDKLKVGQWVLAIGSPFGFEHTATQGIVSALGRSLPGETYVPYIQTDVAVNPGNSGGPLFNTDGEVIGINSQIYSNTGGYIGLSFAVPIDEAMQVAEELKTNGHVTRGWLGVLIQPVDQALARSFGMDRPQGALIAKVEPDSPAAKAGLQPGDIILRYGKTDIETSSQLPPLVGETAIGDDIPVTIRRDGDTRNVRIRIETLPEQIAGTELTDKAVYPLHMSVAELTDDQRKTLDIAKGGVLVTGVDPGPAADAGIRRGDVLLMINGHQIEDIADLVSQIKKLPKDKPVPVFLRRDGNPLFLALKHSTD